MLKNYLQLLLNKSSLTKEEAKDAMNIILEGADPLQSAAFLAILKYRGEKANEIAGMLEALQEKALPVNLPFPVLDIAGTGGDFANTVNISTGSAILAAACGIPVAKHGGRSVSSKSGSADVLEALGIKFQSSPNQVVHSLQEAGIAYMFAPDFHYTLKKISPIRKGLKVPTVFNILCTLLNPAEAEYALIGVANESTLERMSQVAAQLKNRKRTLLFHGCGLDELTPIGKMTAYDIQDGKATCLEIDPVSLGFKPCSLKELQGGDAQLNASILKNAFSGQQSAVADALIFNAGAAIWIFGKAPTLIEGVQMARQAQQEGKALNVLNKWIEISNKQGN